MLRLHDAVDELAVLRDDSAALTVCFSLQSILIAFPKAAAPPDLYRAVAADLLKQARLVEVLMAFDTGALPSGGARA